ncbi:MAG: histidine phosphatase family protein [Parasporobacterium sp.]|nr:histidine phosphatase family protein [Parasporobacterium sp.]
MKVILIRHGATPGNLKHRYIGGRTDQHLSEAGADRLRELFNIGIYPDAEHIYISPMIRCRETGAILFPNARQSVVAGLKEMDFGIFEGRSASEMEKDEAYQKWVASECEDPIPEGEKKEDFTERCVRAFLEVMQEGSVFEKDVQEDRKKENGSDEKPVTVFVIHGGTIMAILSRLGTPGRGYYDWYIKNGLGYLCDWDGEKLKVIQEYKDPAENDEKKN